MIMEQENDLQTRWAFDEASYIEQSVKQIVTDLNDLKEARDALYIITSMLRDHRLQGRGISSAFNTMMDAIYNLENERYRSMVSFLPVSGFAEEFARQQALKQFGDKGQSIMYHLERMGRSPGSYYGRDEIAFRKEVLEKLAAITENSDDEDN
jgi:hypothetical protein